MNTETLAATVLYARSLPYAITLLAKATKALHHLVTTPHGRHRQSRGRGRHTK